VNSPPQLPLSAVVGQEDAKLALLLLAVDPHIGGVLLRGEKGTAKSTLARGLAALLPGSAPFVELPIGATEDRVVGSIDLAAALTGGGERFRAGLLAAADGGVLYVDEINLLPDHLVDVLLDAAASGVNRVEREGISHVHPSRFLLVGSMNPEEGDLRPQLLDRFGLAVAVRTARDPLERAAAVRRRLAFDADPSLEAAGGSDVAAAEVELQQRLATSRPAALSEGMVEQVSSLCAAMGAEGLRADLTICRAAAALAGWEGRPAVSAADVRRVAPLALAHRARRDPLEPAGLDEQRLAEALDEHLGPPGPPGPEEGGAGVAYPEEYRTPLHPGEVKVAPPPQGGLPGRRH
jgi:magnesium chelatase subunit D